MAKRWPLPQPFFAAEDSDLFLVNVLMSTIRDMAVDSMGPDSSTRECHELMVKLIARGYKSLVSKRTYLTEDGVEDMLSFLRKEIEDETR